jgi:Tat protein translocase TatB subunit
MFEVGFTEIILICGLALIVLGPERLPKLAVQLGRWVGRARAMARQLRDQLDQEVNIDRDPPWKSSASAPPEADPVPDPDDGRSHANAAEEPVEEGPVAAPYPASAPETTRDAEPQGVPDTGTQPRQP